MAERGSVLVPRGASELLCCMCAQLLSEPLQLSCLHNCCLSCAEKSSAAKEQSADLVAATPKLTTAWCPVCKEDCEVKRSDFVDRRVLRCKAIANASFCSVCSNGRNPSQSAAVRCRTCSVALCEACTLSHRAKFLTAHEMTPLNEVTSWDNILTEPAPLCSTHRNTLTCACMSCKSCGCDLCWVSCTKHSHDVRRLSDPIVTTYLQKVRNTIAGLERDLLRKTDEILNAKKSAAADIEKRFEGDVNELERKRLRLLAAVDVACSSAEQRLGDTYGDLLAKATVASSSAAAVRRKLSQALAYDRFVASAGSVTDKLDYKPNLIARFESLQTELGEPRRTVPASTCIVFPSTLPDGEALLDDLIGSWMGVPKLATGNGSKDKPQGT